MRTQFDVISEDDKVDPAEDDDAFGYMSYHMIVAMKDEFAGPRYDSIKDIRFEIQVRTMLMDAWANVSHYLDYKGESSIPGPLQRDFHALSGLFYVADKHFELFYGESLKSQTNARELVGSERPSEIPLDLDTLQAFMDDRLPDRRNVSRRLISELVEELDLFGYTSVGEVADLLDRSESKLERIEARTRATRPHKFSQVAAIRITLREDLGRPKYYRALEGSTNERHRASARRYFVARTAPTAETGTPSEPGAEAWKAATTKKKAVAKKAAPAKKKAVAKAAPAKKKAGGT